LEVRVSQIWLTQERELWSEYQPFAAVVTEFLHEGTERALPAMLGSSELSGKITQIEAEDAIEIRNIRVAGPTPYEGDDVRVLSTLFRVETKNWAARTLTIVEQITGAVGVPSLIAAKTVADAVVSGISQFVGDDSFQLRCGQYQAWSSPDDPDNPGATELKPMHYVVMRRPLDKDDDDPGAGFTVKGGRLHVVENGKAKPYTQHDFMLLSIEPRKARDDYRSLPFYKLWQQTQALVVEGDLVGAERLWRKTSGAFYTDELTESQQQLLYAEYKKRYEETVDRFAEADARSRGSGRTAVTIDLQDPVEIILAANQ
jgi:hypothetical protein